MRQIGSGEAPAGDPRVLDQQMMLPRVGGLHPISRDLASEPRQPHHPLRDGGLYDRMLLIVAAIDRYFGVDGVAHHPLLARWEGCKLRIAKVEGATRRGLLVQCQHARRQAGFSVINQSGCC